LLDKRSRLIYHPIKVKKLISLGVIFIFFFVCVGGAAAKETKRLNFWERPIYRPRLLPTSPFYFLKTWKEKWELSLARTVEARIAKEAEIAHRRLAEAKVLLEKKPELAEKWLEKYQQRLENLDETIEKLPPEKAVAVKEHVAEMTLKHQKVLLEVLEKAPESAQKGLQNALEKSVKGHQRVVETLEKDRQKKIKEKVQKNQGKILEKMEKVQMRIGERAGTEAAEKFDQLKEEIKRKSGGFVHPSPLQFHIQGKPPRLFK